MISRRLGCHLGARGGRGRLGILGRLRWLGSRNGLQGWRGAGLRRGGRPRLGWFWERRASFHQAQGAGD